MISRPPVAPSESPTPPDCLKKQKAASLVLYIALVLLALWVVRDFIAVAAWAGVIAIALWPLLQKAERCRWLAGRTTLIAAALTVAIALLVVLPVGVGIAQALREAHDMNEWFKAAQENGIPKPDVIQRLPFARKRYRAYLPLMPIAIEQL
ncbi:MAG: AI-2E family transporter, partial [Paraburkholderia nemoris]